MPSSISQEQWNILAFYFKLSQYVIHSVQNNTAINIATAIKWMAINEECLIWGVYAAHKHNNILVSQSLLYPQLKIFLSRSNSWICSSFWDANLATHARAAVSEGNTFPIVANRDFKEGWFSLWSEISAAKNEDTTCFLKFTWSSCKKVCLLWDLLFVSNFLWCCLLFRWLSTKNVFVALD